MPCVRNDRPLCTLTLTQLPAAYSVSLNGLSCQLDSPSEIFNIQPEVYQATVCQMASEGFTSILLHVFPSPFSHLRRGHALYDFLRVFDLYINNTLRRLNKNIFHEHSVNIRFYHFIWEAQKLKPLVYLLLSFLIFTPLQISFRLCHFHTKKIDMNERKNMGET